MPMRFRVDNPSGSGFGSDGVHGFGDLGCLRV